MDMYGNLGLWSLSGTPIKNLRTFESMGLPLHYWVGKLASGVVVTVRYTRRAGKVRIFGCAKWRNFRRLYDERTKAKKP